MTLFAVVVYGDNVFVSNQISPLLYFVNKAVASFSKPLLWAAKIPDSTAEPRTVPLLAVIYLPPAVEIELILRIKNAATKHFSEVFIAVTSNDNRKDNAITAVLKMCQDEMLMLA
jgi:hypothetical protein